MKVLMQDIRKGELRIGDVPAPQVTDGALLIQVQNSAVSAGTERMVVDFSEKNLLQKARARPDLVRQTVEKARKEGLLATFDAVQNRLAQPLALGYSCAGTVVEVGAAVTSFKAGDRVACAGGGYALHAEFVAVPENLVVAVPAEVDLEAAAFATLGAIALQGIRLADVKLGEVVAVIGLGLLGQLTVQMLKSAGCIVLGMDLQGARADLAKQLGADAVATGSAQLNALTAQYTQGHGADAVIIAADTRDNGPITLAGEIARKKGVVVAVGAVGMDIPRKTYYEKELDFRVSSSYGPGRYDPAYEEKGHDYPYAYVRWTENRNMQAFIQLLAERRVDVAPLITHRFAIAKAADAYDLITGKRDEPFLGVLLTYPQAPDRGTTIHLQQWAPAAAASNIPLAEVRLGVLGAGNFANASLLPAISKLDGVTLVGIASSRGLSARTTGDRFGFKYCSTDNRRIFDDDAVNTVAILTRHHQHAEQVVHGLEAGKHVFVEKPLCLTSDELAWIRETLTRLDQEGRRPALMVGYNRRFAPMIVELKQRLNQVHEPLMLHYRVNAGYIPPDHWTQDPQQGGGRLLGEGVHFIDLLMFLVGKPVQSVDAVMLPDSGRYRGDNFLVTLRFSDGSVGAVTYTAGGNSRFGKEYLELFGGGLAARLDDYRSLEIAHGGDFVRRRAWLRQDKGHRAAWQAWAAHLKGEAPAPMTVQEIYDSTAATLAARHNLFSGRPETIAAPSAAEQNEQQ